VSCDLFDEKELNENSVIRNFRITASDQKQYLVFAEGQAMRRVPMYMKYWITKLHGFLTINDRNILTHAGKISHEMAKELAETEYEKFTRLRIQQADATGGEFEKAIQQLPPPPKKKGGKK
jgi:hypothetical protein